MLFRFGLEFHPFLSYSTCLLVLVLFQPGGVLGFALFYLPYLLLYGRFALLVLFFLLLTLLLALARWALLNAGEALLVITAATQ